MGEKINFDQSTLPMWAQEIPEVVELCKVDLGFRCDVCRAETQQIRNLLIKQAERWAPVLPW
jgi:hypothetical protein